MRTETYVCDGCGKVKGETNHWFTAAPDRTAMGHEFIIVRPACHVVKNGAHLCGASCLMAHLGKWAESQRGA